MTSEHLRQMLSYKSTSCDPVYILLLHVRWIESWLTCWGLKASGQRHKVPLEATH